MATTAKVSVAIGRDELRLARTAAQREGTSLSAFITKAVRARVEERRRMDAARRVIATFEPEDLPSADEQRALLAQWESRRIRKTCCPCAMASPSLPG